nr:MAG TPA: Dynamin family [Caudoviricetes sp.]
MEKNVSALLPVHKSSGKKTFILCLARQSLLAHM